ncbi:MAG: SDR family oxidoreductase, partial [Planktothrix sp.]
MVEQQKGQWDGGRFLKTLAYFGVIPFIGNISWIQNLLGMGKKQPQQKPNIILVVGATGGVGKRVVKRLQQRGITVRCLVRDIKRARTLLGNTVELIEADLTIPQTLTSAIFQDVT